MMVMKIATISLLKICVDKILYRQQIVVAWRRTPKWMATKIKTELNELKEVVHEVAETLKEGNAIMREHDNFKMLPM